MKTSSMMVALGVAAAAQLAQAPCEVPLGSNWLTFLPDNDLLAAAVSSAESEEIVARFASRHVAIAIQDRSTDEADWY